MKSRIVWIKDKYMMSTSEKRVLMKYETIDNVPTLHLFDEIKTSKKPLVIFLHGYGEKKEENLKLAYKLAMNGAYIVLFDANNHGERQTEEYRKLSNLEKDSLIMRTMIETAKSIDRIIDSISCIPFVEISRTALIGFSMGGNIIYYYISKLYTYAISVVIPCISTPVWGNAFRSYAKQNNGASRYFTEERLKEIEINQPSNNIENYRGQNILVIIGENDPRVNIGEMEEFYKRIKQKAKNSDLIIQKDIGHRVTDQSKEAIINWIKKHL
jgi:predicted esterase